jgi:hypothetical protein
VATQGLWIGKWPGEWFGSPASQSGEMSGSATISIRAAGTLTSAQQLDFTYLTTSDWAATAVTESLRRARLQAWQELQKDIDDELICIFASAIN